jgi:hypothetical protein
MSLFFILLTASPWDGQLKKDEEDDLGVTCSMHEEKKPAHNAWKLILVRPKRRWENNINMDLKTGMWV